MVEPLEFVGAVPKWAFEYLSSKKELMESDFMDNIIREDQKYLERMQNFQHSSVPKADEKKVEKKSPGIRVVPAKRTRAFIAHVLGK